MSQILSFFSALHSQNALYKHSQEERRKLNNYNYIQLQLQTLRNTVLEREASLLSQGGKLQQLPVCFNSPSHREELIAGGIPELGVLGFLAGERKSEGRRTEDSHVLKTKQLRFKPNCTVQEVILQQCPTPHYNCCIQPVPAVITWRKS